MRKSDRQLLTVGLIGATVLGGIAYFRPSVFSGIFAKRGQALAATPIEGIRLYILGIPNERYLLNASAAEGVMTPTWLAQNKPFTLSQYGSLNVDLKAPAPSVITMVVTEQKTGRKITQRVPISQEKVQQQAYFEFRTAEGRFGV
jgi:hypothetical protein